MKYLLILILSFSVLACNQGGANHTAEHHADRSLGGAGDAPADGPPSDVHTEPHGPAGVQLNEVFVTPSREADNVDSIGVFNDGGESHWALVTAKATDKILIFDAESGEMVREFGQTGTGEGEFKRPNGILVQDDLALVIERDNHRVQVFQLPEMKFLANIGPEILERPYGGTIFKDEEGVLHLYVTDDFKNPSETEDEAEERNIPAAKLAERIKYFKLRWNNGQFAWQLIKKFGAKEGEGSLYKVESIQADPKHNRLFVSDEKGPHRGIKIYTMAGEYTGKMVDTSAFGGEPEGIGIYRGADRDLLVCTDQQPTVSVFHLFDLASMKHLGKFHGAKTTNTDGIAVNNAAGVKFPKGALWAIHDDQALACFNWEDIEKVLK